MGENAPDLRKRVKRQHRGPPFSPPFFLVVRFSPEEERQESLCSYHCVQYISFPDYNLMCEGEKLSNGTDESVSKVQQKVEEQLLCGKFSPGNTFMQVFG